MSKAQTLIALVATAVMVDGERRVIAAGQPLPPLDAADTDALLAAKAARADADAAPAEAATDPEAPEAPTAAAKKARAKT